MKQNAFTLTPPSYFGFILPRVAPRIEVHHTDPSMDRSIKIVRQIEEVFEPYCMMFKKLKGREKPLPTECFCKANIKTFGRRDFRFQLEGESITKLRYCLFFDTRLPYTLAREYSILDSTLMCWQCQWFAS
jgi:hypothetical protein